MKSFLKSAKAIFISLFVLKCGLLSSQISIEGSFGLVEGKSFNFVAEQLTMVGQVPNIENRYSIYGSLLIEKTIKSKFSGYMALQCVDRKIYYDIFFIDQYDFHYTVMEFPIGLRFRTRIKNDSYLRFNLGAGANYAVTDDNKTKASYSPLPSIDYQFQFQRKTQLSWFTQTGIGFETKISESSIFSAALNYQLQLSELFFFKGYSNWYPSGYVSGGVRPSYLSLLVSYSYKFKKRHASKPQYYMD